MLSEELKMEVLEPVYTMLTGKETKEDAVAEYKKCKEMKTVICPPTCTVSPFFNKDAVVATGSKVAYIVTYVLRPL